VRILKFPRQKTKPAVTVVYKSINKRIYQYETLLRLGHRQKLPLEMASSFGRWLACFQESPNAGGVMTPSQQAKAAGLSSLAEVSRMTGQSPQTLNNWSRRKPDLFQVVIAGCASIKRGA
jgi:hypothetical protein